MSGLDGREHGDDFNERSMFEGVLWVQPDSWLVCPHPTSKERVFWSAYCYAFGRVINNHIIRILRVQETFQKEKGEREQQVIAFWETGDDQLRTETTKGTLRQVGGKPGMTGAFIEARVGRFSIKGSVNSTKCSKERGWRTENKGMEIEEVKTKR